MDVTTGLKTFREKGFEEALVDARELAEDLDVEAVFQSENRHVRKRRLFDYKAADEPLSDPKETFKVQCFNQVVDKALQTLKPRFEQLTKH